MGLGIFAVRLYKLNILAKIVFLQKGSQIRKAIQLVVIGTPI